MRRRVPGETVLVQEVWRERVWAARPMIVARDDDLVALWFPKGTGWKRPVTPPSRARHPDRGIRHATLLREGDWVFVDAAWDVSTLVLMWPTAWHAIWVSWLDDGSQWGWYVNLQEPFRRSSCGFETMDLALDVLVDNDLTWRWKDADELDTFVSMGVLDQGLAVRLREEGQRVARKAEYNEPPFNEPWSDWRPDPTWPAPELPSGWDELCR